MKQPSSNVLLTCPKCQSGSTTKNGTVPGKLGRIQRFRCNNCKHIWNDATLEIKPPIVARASDKSLSKVKLKQSPAQLSRTSTRSSDRNRSNSVTIPQTLEPHAFKSALTHHRMLQLDIPLDWSPPGLLEFARAAQHNLVQAAAPFGHPGQAELEWEALSPALKSYIQARQHLDVALLLHLQTVLTAHQTIASLHPDTANTEHHDQFKAASQPTQKQRNERLQKQKHHLKATSKKPPKPVTRKKYLPATSVRSAPKLEVERISSSETSSQTGTEEPDRKDLLELLSEFQTERQAWRQERTLLQNSVHELEQIQSRNTLRLTSVTHEFERLKKQVLEPKNNIQAVTPSATAETNSTKGLARDSTPKAKSPDVLPTSSSSKRTVPPKYTAREEANLERLASSLMANLVRLEGFRVQPRDLPHITGERGLWKPVIEHLLTLGKIERQGDFIILSLVERLRRGLQSSAAKPFLEPKTS
jgi:hypothetical protein